MHLLYKVVRAATPNQLYQDFKPVRKVDKTYDQMQGEAMKAVAEAVVGTSGNAKQTEKARSHAEWESTLCDLFIRAAAHGHSKAVSVLLKNGKIPPVRLANFSDEHEQAALYKAAFHGHKSVVKVLVQAGAELDRASADTGATPLAAAAQNGHLSIVKHLLKHGAEIDKKGVKGATPLYVACEEGHTDVVALLLERGADAEEPLNKGDTPMSIAKEKGYDDVQALLEQSLKLRLQWNQWNQWNQ